MFERVHWTNGYICIGCNRDFNETRPASGLVWRNTPFTGQVYHDECLCLGERAPLGFGALYAREYMAAVAARRAEGE